MFNTTLPSLVVQAGWLMKLVGRVKKTWRRRLFLLKDDFLLCYAAQDSSFPDHIFRQPPPPMNSSTPSLPHLPWVWAGDLAGVSS
jgi:hypothetical protein